MELNLNKVIERNKGWSRGKRKAVVKIDGLTGKITVYKSIGVAIDSNPEEGLYRSSITYCCKGRYHTAGNNGSDWCYLEDLFDLYFGI